jgi:hypothetical protein
MGKNNIFFDTCVYHQPGIDLLTKVVPVDNILFASEMVGAVKGIDPEDRLRLRRHQALCRQRAAQRRRPQKIFEGNARKVFSRLKTKRGDVKALHSLMGPSIRIGDKAAESNESQRTAQGASRVRASARAKSKRAVGQGFWTDLYHRAMTVYWPVFFGSAAADLHHLSTRSSPSSIGSAIKPIANVAPICRLSLFYFSIETLATVGYGDMHPQTNYGHLVATVEIFTGMCFLAVMTGLIFARFSRPRARFVFAEHPVVATIRAVRR